jgi:Plasmid pRiA4b ORF-3-like protein
MIYKFKIISDKAEDFVLHIDADAKSTFYELHEAIQFACKFDSAELTAFYLADEEWDKGTEIVMFNDDLAKDFHSPMMKNTTLGELLQSPEDKLIYTFDVINQKSLYIQLNAILMEEKLNSPVVSFDGGTTSTEHHLSRYNLDLLADNDLEFQNAFTDFGELEDFNTINGELGEAI